MESKGDKHDDGIEDVDELHDEFKTDSKHLQNNLNNKECQQEVVNHPESLSQVISLLNSIDHRFHHFVVDSHFCKDDDTKENGHPQNQILDESKLDKLMNTVSHEVPKRWLNSIFKDNIVIPFLEILRLELSTSSDNNEVEDKLDWDRLNLINDKNNSYLDQNCQWLSISYHSQSSNHENESHQHIHRDGKEFTKTL